LDDIYRPLSVELRKPILIYPSIWSPQTWEPGSLNLLREVAGWLPTRVHLTAWGTQALHIFSMRYPKSLVTHPYPASPWCSNTHPGALHSVKTGFIPSSGSPISEVQNVSCRIVLVVPWREPRPKDSVSATMIFRCGVAYMIRLYRRPDIAVAFRGNLLTTYYCMKLSMHYQRVKKIIP
jgi:hypothetical protein